MMFLIHNISHFFFVRRFKQDLICVSCPFKLVVQISITVSPSNACLNSILFHPLFLTSLLKLFFLKKIQAPPITGLKYPLQAFFK